jgi:hypothetical protein
MNESIIVGLAVGIGVAAIGAYVGHCLHLREMRAQWAEEERRKKSERRRELLQRELTCVSEFVNLVPEAWSELAWWAHVEKRFKPGSRAELGKEAYLMVPKANMAASSVDNEWLSESLGRLVDAWVQCNQLVDGATGEPPEGKEGEYEQLQFAMRQAGADVRRRIRQLLE